MEKCKIFSTGYSLESLKSSGYRDAAHAVAELIDNSIQAGQNSEGITSVELICIEEKISLKNRSSRQIKKIAIYDDASGMSPETLSLCLAVGRGTRLGAKKGMGKFGVGLPQASISQCNRVDIWSWQNEIIYHTYLDDKEIRVQEYDTVPEPKLCNTLPSEWRDKIKAVIKESGTLIV